MERRRLHIKGEVMTRCFLLLFFLFVVKVGSGAQEPELKWDVQSELFTIYKSGRIERWVNVIHKLKEHPQLATRSDLQYELAFALYGYIGNAIEKGNTAEVEKYLNDAIVTAQELAETTGYEASGNSLLGTLYAFDIKVHLYKLPFLSAKGMRVLNKAGEIDSTNVHYLVEQGNQLFYSPHLFGGDKAEAVQYYQKALNEMAHSDYFQKSWFRINTMEKLVQGYRSIDEQANADTVQQKILQLFPELSNRVGK